MFDSCTRYQLFTVLKITAVGRSPKPCRAGSNPAARTKFWTLAICRKSPYPASAKRNHSPPEGAACDPDRCEVMAIDGADIERADRAAAWAVNVSPRRAGEPAFFAARAAG